MQNPAVFPKRRVYRAKAARATPPSIARDPTATEPAPLVGTLLLPVVWEPPVAVRVLVTLLGPLVAVVERLPEAVEVL